MKNRNYYANRASKLACGQKLVVPGYGVVRAYKAKSGKRMMSVSKNPRQMNGGNLPVKMVVREIESGMFWA